MFQKCKITVIKRMVNTDLVNEYVTDPNIFPKCNKVSDRQEFIVSSPFEMPEGICASAWADIRPYIITIASGGRFSMMKNPDSALATCSDPFRPVIFNIEKIASS